MSDKCEQTRAQGARFGSTSEEYCTVPYSCEKKKKVRFLGWDLVLSLSSPVVESDVVTTSSGGV